MVAELAVRENPEAIELVEQCYVSTAKFAKAFFPDIFSADFSPEHDKIFVPLDDKSVKLKAFAAPRGVGKTSIARARVAKAICYREYHFIVYISDSLTKAEMETENLKFELCANDLVKKTFGDVRATYRDDEYEDSFSKKSWVANGYTLILPRGSGQQVRGLNFRGYRPELIVIDDLEDTETVDNEVVRMKRKSWFLNDLLKTVPRTGGFEVIYIDTLKHQDSLLANIMKWQDWKSVRIELCDDDLISKFPSFMNDEAVRVEYESSKEKGDLDGFYREFRNLIIAGEDASYRPEYFRYYDEGDMDLNADRGIVNVITVDPAKTVKLHSCESGIIGWGIDSAKNRFYLRDVVGRKLHPDELYDAIFEMAKKLNAKVIGVETTSLEDFIMQPLVNEMVRRGLYFNIIPLKAVGKKETRGGALVPYYRKGLVYHNKAVSQPLEAQMLSFPKNERWDLLDAAVYLVKLLEEGEVYFEPTEEADADVEKEYAELMSEDDEPVEGWCIA